VNLWNYKDCHKLNSLPEIGLFLPVTFVNSPVQFIQASTLIKSTHRNQRTWYISPIPASRP